MSDTEIKEKEQQGVLDDLARDFSPEERERFGDLAKNDPDSGGLYKEDNGKSQKSNGRLSGKKKGIIGAVAGLLVGSGIIGFSVLNGPLQFGKLSNALGKHSRLHGLVADTRLFQFSRAARAYKTGNIGETRVGFFGSKSFNGINDRLKSQHGIDFNLRSETGRLHNARILPPESSPLYGVTAEETQANIRKHLALPSDITLQPITGGDGSHGVRLLLRDTRGAEVNRIGRAVVDLDAQTSNKVDGRLHNSMRFRFLRKVWGAPALFSPLSRAAYDLDQRARTRIEVRDRQKADADRKKAVGKKATLRSRYSGAVDNARSKIGPTKLRNLSAGLAVTGALCTLNEISDLLPALNYAAVVAPAMEEAIDKQALGSQLMSGQNFYLDQYGDASTTFSDEEGSSIWSSKPLNALADGGGGEGADADPALKQAFQTQGSSIGSLVDLFIQNSGDNALIEAAALGGDEFADVACSPVGYGIQLVAGVGLAIVAPGGAALKSAQFAQSTAISLALTNLFTSMVGDQAEGAVKDLCGQDEEGVTVDAEAYGSCMAFGARAAQNLNGASMGGVQLTDTQETALLEALEDQEVEDFRSKSLFARMFDVNEPRSFVASTFSNLDTADASGLSRLASSLLSVPKLLASMFGNVTKLVSAEPTNYDWGFPLISLPLDIINNPEYEDPFDNANKAAAIFESNRGEDYIEKAKKCFGVEIKDVNARWQATPVEEVVTLEDDYVNANCNNLDDKDWVRVMLFVFDDSIVTTMGCYEGNEALCQEFGFGSGSTASGSNSAGGVGISSDGFVFPLQTTKDTIINHPSERWCYKSQTNCHHDYNAADIFAPTGTLVLAARAGEVLRATDNDGSSVGSRVTIKGEDGLLYYYTHMGDGTITVSVGDTVTAGQIIGRIGTRADAVNTTQHLHFDALPSQYESRPACSGAGCAAHPFINVQPPLVEAFNALP